MLDFSKAIDTVPNRRLLRKLELLGVHGVLHSWIRAFLTGRTHSVMIDGCRSPPDRVESGMPQGTVLGVRLLSDDLLVYRSIKSQADQVQLQHGLDALGA